MREEARRRASTRRARAAARRRVTVALVAASAMVLAVVVVRSTGGDDPSPVASTRLEQDTPSSAAGPAGSQAPLPDPVVLDAGSPARRVALAVFEGSGGPVDIPDVALSAYQRAATIINDADPGCRLDWTLVAAIGYVESDHGRHAGSRLDEDGVARPAIRGIRLDGTRDTQRIRDTDAGLHDGDQRFDRAVGPMQILPSTWSLIGVDADGDDVRDPQDVDDAALAAAVYLCFGSLDLSAEAGRRAAVHRYNPDDDYVALVLRIADGYADTETTFVETIGLVSAPVLPTGTTPALAARERSPDSADLPAQGTPGHGAPPSGPPSTATPPTTTKPTTAPTTTPPTTTPPTTTTTSSPAGSATPSGPPSVGPS